MHLGRFLVLVLLVTASGLVAADRVTPSDRVTSNLRVRADANTNSSIVHRLLPGESLRHVGEVPFWHQLELPDGSTGFVSKAWSVVIPESEGDATPTPAGPALELRVGTWNIKKLGHGSKKRFDLLVDVIDANFDVIAVVEVMQKGGTHPGFDDLMTELGGEWTGVVTAQPRPNTTSGSAEFYAVMFRESRARLCDGWTTMRISEDPGGHFSRPPAFTCVAALSSTGGVGFDFLLATYHARFAEGDTDDIAAEVGQLPGIVTQMQSSRPGEGDIIIAGDFNLVPGDLSDTMGREIDTVGTGSTLNRRGDRTQNLYDHLLVMSPSATTEFSEPGKVIDVRNIADDDKHFFNTVSDHLPIVSTFLVPTVDDD